MRESLAELAGLIDRYAGADGIHETPIPRLHLFRSSRTTEPIYALHEPALCLIAQGRKQAMLGSQVNVYDRAQYLMVSVDVPVVGKVIEASPQSPYLSLRFDLDPEMLSALLLEVEGATAGDGSPGPALSPSTVTPELLDAVIRLLRLLAVPKDIPALAPLVEKEILYRLLVGEQSAKFREIALGAGRLQQINRAIKWIKQNYCSPLRIEHVAAEARMSPSSLHSHFKSVTAMSPLQYQK